MKVLVTGGAGFIGSHVVDALIEAGHEVSALDYLVENTGGRLANLHPAARLHQIDIRDHRLDQVFDMEHPEVVFHQAAQASLSLSTRLPLYDVDVNIKGSLNLLEQCVKYGVRKVVFASSSAIYGAATRLTNGVAVRRKIHEESFKRPPESPYGVAKLAVEGYLHCWKELHGLDYTILRYGNVYGPRQTSRSENGVVAIFADAILRGQPIRIDWDGEQSKDYVYVGDVAQANLLALEKGSGQAYCIGTGHTTSINALHMKLVEIIGHDVQVARAPKRPGDVYYFAFDSSKAKRDLGWEPQVGIEEGLRRTVDYFRGQMDKENDA